MQRKDLEDKRKAAAAIGEERDKGGREMKDKEEKRKLREQMRQEKINRERVKKPKEKEEEETYIGREIATLRPANVHTGPLIEIMGARTAYLSGPPSAPSLSPSRLSAAAGGNWRDLFL